MGYALFIDSGRDTYKSKICDRFKQISEPVAVETMEQARDLLAPGCHLASNGGLGKKVYRYTNDSDEVKAWLGKKFVGYILLMPLSEDVPSDGRGMFHDQFWGLNGW